MLKMGIHEKNSAERRRATVRQPREGPKLRRNAR